MERMLMTWERKILRKIYGAETWAVTSKMERMLMTWERKILRKIYGPTKENGQWRIYPYPANVKNRLSS
jgi:hypothetical protein